MILFLMFYVRAVSTRCPDVKLGENVVAPMSATLGSLIPILLIDMYRLQVTSANDTCLSVVLMSFELLNILDRVTPSEDHMELSHIDGASTSSNKLDGTDDHIENQSTSYPITQE